MVNDFDRLYNAEVNIAHPVAYAMKGSSMNNKTFMTMMTHVISESEKKGIPILATSSDGQWHRYGVRDHNDRPLTILQLQKDHWKATASMDKKTIICQMKDIFSVTSLSDTEFVKIPSGPIVVHRHKTDRAITGRLCKIQEGNNRNYTDTTGQDQFTSSNVAGTDDEVSTSSVGKDTYLGLLADDTNDSLMMDIEHLIEDTTLSSNMSSLRREMVTGSREQEGIFEIDSWIFQASDSTSDDSSDLG
jgi:hypothetical protein